MTGRIARTEVFTWPQLANVIFPSGVPPNYLSLLFLDVIRQDLLEDLLAPGQGGFRMGIVRTPQGIVHPDDMPVPYPQAIFLEAKEYVLGSSPKLQQAVAAARDGSLADGAQR